MNDIITERWIIAGVVQGVGMRFYINRTAIQYALAGYVQNLYDGTVLCIVQGPKPNVEFFHHHLKAQSPGRIDRISREPIENPRTYAKFSVKLF